MAKLKYMGTSDIRAFEKGENFGGRLAEKTTVEVRWDWSNNHLINTDDEKYKDVSDETWDLIREDPEIKDVTELKRIPAGAAEKMWKSVKESVDNDVAEGGSLGDPSKATAIPDATPATTPTTTGGSTGGATPTANTRR